MACNILLATMFLSSCSGNGDSHLPSVFELPGAIVGSAIDNATYNVKRRKVEAYVANNYEALREDVEQGGGQVLEGALDSAGIKGGKRNQAKNDLISNRSTYFYNTEIVTGNLINPFASLYLAREADKKINGFSYTEARQIIKNFADQNFEELRLSVKSNQGSALDGLASRLNIQDPQKRSQFKQKSQRLYKTIYLETVTVVFMVNR